MSASAPQLAAALRARLDLQPGERLYGVVDAAQDAELAFEAERRFGVRTRMLFQGEAAPYMKEIAPYLIPIDPTGEYLEFWTERWGKHVGIFLTTSVDPERLLVHLREIFVVQDEEGQEYFLRFYDPRVLRRFLPTCTPEEARGFFGPIRTFLTEAHEPGVLLRFAVSPEGASLTKLALSPILQGGRP